jgi:hypothetical protein
MGALIKFSKWLKDASKNKDGKTQILPKFSIWLLIALVLSVSPIFYEPPQGADMLSWTLAVLSLIIWCLKQVLQPETKLIEYTAWLIMVIIALGSIYIGYYLLPIVF